jgi:hypothetical protein
LVPRHRLHRRRQTADTAVGQGDVHGSVRRGRHLEIALV